MIDIDISQDDAIGVIQCASKKRLDAGHFVADDGRKVMFVADPAAAPTSRSLRYARPDDAVPAGATYRARLERYNRDSRTDNPWELLPAWQLTCPRRTAPWLTLWAWACVHPLCRLGIGRGGAGGERAHGTLSSGMCEPEPQAPQSLLSTELSRATS